MFIHTYDELGLENEGWTVAAFHQMPLSEIVTVTKWCYDTYGIPGERWKDDIVYGEVRFDDKKDLMLFVMRFS